MMGRYYLSAAVCSRGHTASSNVPTENMPAPSPFSQELQAVPAERFCTVCGTQILTACSNCNKRIRGIVTGPGIMAVPAAYKPPDFCDHCGVPHPWATRQARLWRIENLLETNGLSGTEQLILREKFEELANSDLTEDQQVEKWKVVRRIVPDVLVTVRKVGESLLTSYMKGELGL